MKVTMITIDVYERKTLKDGTKAQPTHTATITGTPRAGYVIVTANGFSPEVYKTIEDARKALASEPEQSEEQEQNEEPEEEIRKTGVFYRTTIYSKIPNCEPYTLDQTTLKRAKEWVEYETKCAYNSGATVDRYTRIGSTWSVERVLQWGEIKSPE